MFHHIDWRKQVAAGGSITVYVWQRNRLTLCRRLYNSDSTQSATYTPVWFSLIGLRIPPPSPRPTQSSRLKCNFNEQGRQMCFCSSSVIFLVWLSPWVQEPNLYPILGGGGGGRKWSCWAQYMNSICHVGVLFLPSFLPHSYLPPFLPSSLPPFLPSSLPPLLPSSLPHFLTSSLPHFLTSSLPHFLPSSLPPFLPLHTFIPSYLPTFLPSSLPPSHCNHSILSFSFLHFFSSLWYLFLPFFVPFSSLYPGFNFLPLF
jgi:hypothetical protein